MHIFRSNIDFRSPPQFDAPRLDGGSKATRSRILVARAANARVRVCGRALDACERRHNSNALSWGRRRRCRRRARRRAHRRSLARRRGQNWPSSPTTSATINVAAAAVSPSSSAGEQHAHIRCCCRRRRRRRRRSSRRAGATASWLVVAIAACGRRRRRRARLVPLVTERVAFCNVEERERARRAFACVLSARVSRLSRPR